MSKHTTNYYICPVCGEILYLSDYLFLDDGGGVIGCEKCYATNDVTALEMMTTGDYLNQGCVSHIDHQIDDLKESQ